MFKLPVVNMKKALSNIEANPAKYIKIFKSINRATPGGIYMHPFYHGCWTARPNATGLAVFDKENNGLYSGKMVGFDPKNNCWSFHLHTNDGIVEVNDDFLKQYIRIA